MRVLAVGNMYPPHHRGGYELVWRSAMHHLREQGHIVRVLTTDFRTDTGAPDEPDTFRELRWYWRDDAWLRISLRERIAVERHNAAVLARHLEELAPDVVSWWSMGGMSLALLERVRRVGLPAVAFALDDWLLYAPVSDRWTGPFRRLPFVAPLVEFLTGLPTRVDLDASATFVLVSEAVRRHAREAGYRLEGSRIAHTGVDPEFLNPRPEGEWGWRLLYVGRINESKGVTDAVDALAALEEPTASLTIAGAGEQRALDPLLEQVRGLGLDGRVHMLGMQARSQLPAVYEAADVVLFPVRWEEPWGVVQLEAMALGRPVVTTGTGGTGEYLRDGENCLLVAPERPEELAAAVRRLHGDPGLRARLRTGGSATARRHTETIFNEAALAALSAACV